jgi:hypothetical protein
MDNMRWVGAGACNKGNDNTCHHHSPVLILQIQCHHVLHGHARVCVSWFTPTLICACPHSCLPLFVMCVLIHTRPHSSCITQMTCHARVLVCAHLHMHSFLHLPSFWYILLVVYIISDLISSFLLTFVPEATMLAMVGDMVVVVTVVVSCAVWGLTCCCHMQYMSWL